MVYRPRIQSFFFSVEGGLMEIYKYISLDIIMYKISEKYFRMYYLKFGVGGATPSASPSRSKNCTT